ncbi:hypothetical protein [Streptomyces axinellae]|uniref:DUF3558 domain-containing protein n=1 Tax=Streptomyces axinellae TaxID=552788 RepID=A0ABP6C3S5_9ACTN
MGEQRKYQGFVVAAIIAGVLASCSGSHSGSDSGSRSDSGAGSGSRAKAGLGSASGPDSDAGSHGPLSVGRVARMAAGPGATCPVRYDMAAAAKAAAVGKRVRAGTVNGETADRRQPGAPLTLSKGALVSCGYRIGQERARLFTVGVRKGAALDVLLPQIQHDAGMTMTELKGYAARASRGRASEAPGDPLLTPSGNVASVRLPAEGKGDLALVVSLGEERTALTKAQVTDLTRQLADQAHG